MPSMHMEYKDSSVNTKSTDDIPYKRPSFTLPPLEDKPCLHIANRTSLEKLVLSDVQYNGRIVPVDSVRMLNSTSFDRRNKKQCEQMMLKPPSYGEDGVPNSFSKGAHTSADGSVYTGHWVMRNKLESGRRLHRNRDAYKETWKLAASEESWTYLWNMDGSEYEETQRRRGICGHEVISWPDGDAYEDKWFNGEAYGHGAWNGDKHGIKMMTHRPKVCLESYSPEEFKRLVDQEMISHGSNIGTLCLPLDVDEVQLPMKDKTWSMDAPPDRLSKVTNKNRYATEDGKESHASADGLAPSEAHENCKERQQAGEIIYPGHRSYELMLKLQLGIRYSIGKVTPQQSKMLTPGDFGPKSMITVRFPSKGSQMTRSGPSSDFKWKDYCPMVFRQLRELAKIDAADYMLSICGNEGLQELPSPGKSGSVFYLSHDQQYMVKTLRTKEVKVLLRMLPRYYDHVKKYESTLLTRLLGLHSVKPKGGQKVRFMVMANVVATNAQIHERFDLKGSSHGRSTDKADTNKDITLKDLDLKYVFQLEREQRDAVCSQIAEDCKFLESEQIMDYSLLLGLHFKDSSRNSMETQDLPLHEVVISRFFESNGDFVEVNMGSRGLGHLRFERGSGTLEDEKTSFKCAPHNKVGVGWMKVHHPEGPRTQLGYNMPAKACRRILDGRNEYYDARDVTLFFGIIDILQVYDMGKKLEHAYKSIQFDSLSISAVNPTLYSRRFQHLMHRIFQAADTCDNMV